MTLIQSKNTGLTYDDEDLGSILFYCSRLRGVACLPHRTLREFDWFVDTMIFFDYERRVGEIERYIADCSCLGKMSSEEADTWKVFGLDEAEREKRIHAKFREVYDNEDVECDKKLVVYARAFVQYCEDEYGWVNADAEGA